LNVDSSHGVSRTAVILSAVRMTSTASHGSLARDSPNGAGVCDVAMSTMSFAVPNSSALPMNNFPHTAGSAFSPLRSNRFAMGAVWPPGWDQGDHVPPPMAVFMALFALAAANVLLRVVTRGPLFGAAIG
jgi:hypothetical protein